MYCLKHDCREAEKMKPIKGGFECVGCKNQVDTEGLRLGVTREQIVTRVLCFDLTVAEQAAVQRLANEHAKMKAALEEIYEIKDTEYDSGDLIGLFDIAEDGLKGIV